MTEKEVVKIVVTVPEKDADKLRQAIGDASGGQLGNYTHCSFSVKGIGRFLPMDGSQPTIGQVGKLEQVVEERIEITCLLGDMQKVVLAIRQAHPYEEPVIDIYPLLQEM